MNDATGSPESLEAQPVSAESKQPAPARTRRRTFVLGAAGFLTASGLTATIGRRLFSSPVYRGPRSDHFDGARFHNIGRVGERGFRDVWKWIRSRTPGPWRKFSAGPPGPKPPDRVHGARLRATFINHATMLIQTHGLNILTDPIWSDRCSPVGWSGPRRAHPPGIRFEDLPPIDAVLLSHNHYDHLDLPTLSRLAKDHQPKIFCPLGNRALLDSKRIGGSFDMDWWQEAELSEGAELHCVPAQHWSGRGLSDRAGSLWCGFVLRTPHRKVYFAGDTGYGPHFDMVRRKFGPVDLALLPIGAYLPRWFMGPVHMSPAEAIRAHKTLEATRSVGIHFGTFQLADDGQDQAVAALKQTLKDEGVDEAAFWALEFGQGRDVGET